MARLWAKATIFGLTIVFAGFGEAQTQQQDPQPAVLPALGLRAIDPRSESRDVSADDSSSSVLVQRSVRSVPVDRNREIYYRNKLEFSLDGGWLPINIPFPLDVFVGDAYNTYPLKYTLVPIIASLRWHLDGVGGLCSAKTPYKAEKRGFRRAKSSQVVNWRWQRFGCHDW